MTTRASIGRAWRLGAACCALAGCGLGVQSAPSSSSAAPSAISTGPQLGYLWNTADSSLRPILGVPGASQVGQPVTASGLYVTGAASARSSIALLQESDGSLDTMSLPSGAVQRIGGATAPTNSQIVLSPSGQTAILFAPGAATLTLITGLNTMPQPQTLATPGSLVSAAVSDTAQVAAVSGSGQLSVALLTGNKNSIASLSGLGFLGFLPGSDDLLVADSSTSTVTLIRHSSTAPAPQAFTSSNIQSPIAVAASQDGQWAIVANSADQSVVRLDLTGATAPLRIACACQPSQLAAFDGNAVFRLTAPGAGPTWLVDASASTPQTLFIPAVLKP